MLLCASLPGTRPLPDIGRQVGFHEAIVDRIRHGAGDYYTAAIAALRGSDLPLQPFTAFPLPATAIVAAAMPGAVFVALMVWLAGGVAATWSARFAPSRYARSACFGIAAAAMIGAMYAGLAVLPQLWAGLFVALSLALRRPGGWIESVAIGLAAAVVHEAAFLYLGMMAVSAWRDGMRREAAAWAGASAVAALVLSLHAHTAAGTTGTLDIAQNPSAAGFGAVIAALTATTGLSVLPGGIGTALLPVAIGGWFAWRSDRAARALAIVLAYLVLLALMPPAQVSTVFLIVPLTLLGLLPAIDGIRDLVCAALDSRRITVTRVVR